MDPQTQNGFLFFFACKPCTKFSFYVDFEQLMNRHGWYSLIPSKTIYWGKVNNLRAFVLAHEPFVANHRFRRLFQFTGHRDLIREDNCEIPPDTTGSKSSFVLFFEIDNPSYSLPAELRQFLLRVGGWEGTMRQCGQVFERKENNLPAILPGFVLLHPALSLRLSCFHVFRLEDTEKYRVKRTTTAGSRRSSSMLTEADLQRAVLQTLPFVGGFMSALIPQASATPQKAPPEDAKAKLSAM